MRTIAHRLFHTLFLCSGVSRFCFSLFDPILLFSRCYSLLVFVSFSSSLFSLLLFRSVDSISLLTLSHCRFCLNFLAGVTSKERDNDVGELISTYTKRTLTPMLVFFSPYFRSLRLCWCFFYSKNPRALFVKHKHKRICPWEWILS